MLLAVDEQTVAGWEMGTTKLNGAAERMIRLMCAEQLRGNGSVRAFLQDTVALDDPADAAEVKMEESGEGWHAVQKAA